MALPWDLHHHYFHHLWAYQALALAITNNKNKIFSHKIWIIFSCSSNFKYLNFNNLFHFSYFPITIHPSDPNTLWVFPIDGTEAWSRVCPEGQPAIYSTNDGGDSWFRQYIGLPMRNAWLTVLRNSLSTDCMVQAGVYFGTTSGSLWMSDNEGNSWRQIAVHLPRILAVESGKILK